MRVRTTNRQQIKYFVQETLGCTCPDDVFKRIRKLDQSALIDTADAVYDIGSRLCIAVYVPANWRDLAKRLGQLVAAGMQYRDQHGFNRFRLVIACSDEDAVVQLPQAFDALPGIDDKVHLHVIPQRQVPFDVSAKTV